MKVYVVECQVDYEPGYIEGVYATKALADAEVNRLNRNNKSRVVEFRSSEFEVTGGACADCRNKDANIRDLQSQLTSQARARLDVSGTAKPIVGVFARGQVNFYSNAQELLVRETAPVAGKATCE